LHPIDYCVALAEGRVTPPGNLDLATIHQQELANTFSFHISQYLQRRAEDIERGIVGETPNLAARIEPERVWSDGATVAIGCD
jgi:amidase